MIYRYTIQLEDEEVKNYCRLFYNYRMYNFICTKSNNAQVSPQQRMQWVNLFINNRIGFYFYRDELFKKYNVPVNVITEYKLNYEDKQLYYNIQEDLR